MGITASQVARVVINGQWYTVRGGTFSVVELGFDDAEGNPMHPPSGVLGYRFVGEAGDIYTGPLSAIELVKVIET